MCDPISMINQSAALDQQAATANAQANLARYKSQMDLANAQIAQQQADNTLKQGLNSMQNQQTKTSQAVGSNLARMAAAGLDVSSGTPANVLGDVQQVGLMDASNIRDNVNSQVLNGLTNVMNLQSQSLLDNYQAQMIDGTNDFNQSQGHFNMAMGGLQKLSPYLAFI